MRDINKPIEVIVAGHLCLDLNRHSAQAAASHYGTSDSGKLINVGQAALLDGGAVSNTGLSLRMLGIRTSLMGKIGSDLLGDTVRKILTQYDAADGLIVDSVRHLLFDVSPRRGSTASSCTTRGQTTLLRLRPQPGSPGILPPFHFGYPPLMQRMYQDGGDELARVFRLAGQAAPPPRGSRPARPRLGGRPGRLAVDPRQGFAADGYFRSQP